MTNADTIPLRALAALRNVRVGAAVDRGFRFRGTGGTRFRAALAREFSMLTPENDMKHERLQPARGSFRFASADSLVAFAQANGMQVRGHTLIWHQQLARWLTSGTWTRAEAQALLDEHVAAVVGHYRGAVSAWDVVNEPFADDGALRAGFWPDNAGPDYIERAFRAARAADPDVALFLNDYNIEGAGAKSDSMYSLVQRLLARGVPITGVGFEGHFIAGSIPTRTDLSNNIARLAALGLKVQFTELDIRVRLPSTADLLQTQARNYRDVFEACLLNSACTAVVTWGVTDAESWIPAAFAGFGEALLLDASYNPKPAFRAVCDLLIGR